MNNKDRRRTRRNVIIFTVLVLGLAVVSAIIEPLSVPPGAEPGTAGLGQLLWIAAPVLVMLLLRAFGGDGWQDLGLAPRFRGNGLWWLVSVLVFPAVIAVSVVIGVLFGGVDLAADMVPAFVAALMPSLIAAAIKNIAEEFAWRGYLAPKLFSLDLNTWLSHAIVGLVWGAWHLPFVYVLWPYLTPSMLWRFVPLLLLGTISQSVVYGEIRLATSSVLPAWLMHTIGNTIGNTLLLSGLVRLVSGRELWFSPGAEGVVSIVVMFAVGYWLHRRRKCTIHD